MVRILPLLEENLGDIQKSFKAHLHGRLKMPQLQKKCDYRHELDLGKAFIKFLFDFQNFFLRINLFG
jgi:hypothetical protein